MNDTLQIQIRFHGGFRKYGECIALDVPQGCDVARVKEALLKALNGQDEALIGDSVLADDASILASNHVFMKGCTLSILPPVCGG
jgi:molybdopterin converting factor small subunit